MKKTAKRCTLTEYVLLRNIILVAFVNQISLYDYLAGNGADIVESHNGSGTTCSTTNGFHDPMRVGTSHSYYDEYTDGDAYLLKIKPSDGSLIWSKNVSHFSSKDFYPQIFQHCNGSYIVSGSTADYNHSDYNQPESYDALVLETPDAANLTSLPDHNWHKAFHGEGAEENMCTFGLNPTADGGFVICGDNTPDECDPKDNFSVNKISPFRYLTTTFNGMTDNDISITGSVTWPNTTYPNNANIKRKVVINAGATLTIGGLYY